MQEVSRLRIRGTPIDMEAIYDEKSSRDSLCNHVTSSFVARTNFVLTNVTAASAK